MARSFNGTTDWARVALNLSAYSALTISLWAWIDAYDNLGNKVLFEFGNPDWSATGGFIAIPDWTSGAFLIGFSSPTPHFWIDTFPRPSAAAWHHYMFAPNRVGGVPSTRVWVDGTQQVTTIVSHEPDAYGNFGNSTLNLFSRASSSLFAAGRIADFYLWGGVNMDTKQAQALAAGHPPAGLSNQGTPALFAPIYGDSPEPDYSGGKHSVTVNGTTVQRHAPVAPFFPPSP